MKTLAFPLVALALLAAGCTDDRSTTDSTTGNPPNGNVTTGEPESNPSDRTAETEQGGAPETGNNAIGGEEGAPDANATDSHSSSGGGLAGDAPNGGQSETSGESNPGAPDAAASRSSEGLADQANVDDKGAENKPKPDASNPETTKPDATRPDTPTRDTPKPDATKPDTPKSNGADARRQGKLFRGGKPGEVIDITFDDLNLGMQADVVFRPFMLNDRVKELEGKKVRISGFILAADRIKGIKEFVVLRNLECKFGPGGQADHLIRVIMKKGETAAYQTKPISIEGVLKLNPFPDARQTWSVFDLQDATKIQTVRR